MSDLEQTLKANELLLVYGELLTPLQKDIMEDYYAYNLSLAEIAKNRRISRAAVSDSLKKSLLKLDIFEKKLQIIAKNKALLTDLDELHNLAKDPEIKEKLNEMKRKNINGI